MEKARPAPADIMLPSAVAGRSDGRGYPDRLDAATLRVAGVCILATIMTILDATIVSVAQRTFIDAFDSTPAVVGWTMTGYTLAMATVIPVAGWAADRFGTKRLWMSAVLAFTLGSLLCALAPNILLLIAFRAVQGIGGGMLMPLGFMILTRVAGPNRLGRMMAVLGIPMMIGPIGGPILGGWLIGAFSWPWMFLINLPIGVCAIALAARMFPRDHPAPSESFDVIGALLLSPGLAMFLFGVSVIPARGTPADRYVLVPVSIGLALIGGFVYHAWHRADHPLIDLRLFEDPVFTRASASMMVFAVAFFGTGLVFPSYFQQVLHQSPTQSGLHLVPHGLGALMTMPLAGTLMDRRGSGKIVLFGVTMVALGLGTFTFGVARHADYLPILLAGLVLMGMGTGCTMTPLTGAAMSPLRPDQIARGSTLISVNSQVGGSMGTALMAVVLTHQFLHSQSITAAAKVAALQQSAARRGAPLDPAAVPQPAKAADFTATVLHDLIHAYTVVFAVATALMVLTLIPASLLPKSPVGRAPVSVLSGLSG